MINYNMKKILNYFFRGLLYTVPLVIVLFVIYKLFLAIGSLVENSGIKVNPIIDPLLGILAFFVVIVLIGILGNTIILKPLFMALEAILEKAPVINIIYTSVKDLTGALFGGKKKYNKPVMVKISHDSNLQKLGFVTRENLSELGIESGLVAVYFPHSFNFSGNLFLVAKENIKPIKAPSSEVMKLIVSGGVAGFVKDGELN
jgi:uncharacterized membrane protein